MYSEKRREELKKLYQARLAFAAGVVKHFGWHPQSIGDILAGMPDPDKETPKQKIPFLSPPWRNLNPSDLFRYSPHDLPLDP